MHKYFNLKSLIAIKPFLNIASVLNIASFLNMHAHVFTCVCGPEWQPGLYVSTELVSGLSEELQPAVLHSTVSLQPLAW